MKRAIVCLMLVPFILTFVSSCKKGPSPEDIFSQAKSLQEEQKYAEAVVKYEELVTLHPKNKLAAQSQFMVGFICANELDELEKAAEAYRAFLENYAAMSDSGMVASARWELENLGKDINEIEDLSVITKGGEESEASESGE
jgi:outer membrane protein assembly factor BamD (BamD/ComL family)